MSTTPSPWQGFTHSTPTKTLDGARKTRCEELVGKIEDALHHCQLSFMLQARLTQRHPLTGILMKTVAAVLISLTVFAPHAHADDDPYQVGPSYPGLPGNQIYPPVCAQYMPACGFQMDPDTQTWHRENHS